VVLTPEEWKWCGHSELISDKNHHRIIDKESLLDLFNGVKQEEFLNSYKSLLLSKLKLEKPPREPGWTETLAVGSQKFIDGLKERYPSRVVLETFEIKDKEFPPGWAVRESHEPFHT
jgi:putative transposase